MKNSIWKNENKNNWWTKWRAHPSRGCFVAGCSLNNHPGRGEEGGAYYANSWYMHAILEAEDYEDTRPKLELKIFQFDNSNARVPSPFQCHRTLANLDPAALFWRNSLWLWIVVEWVCTCVLAEAEDSGDVVFLEYTSMEIFHWKSMQVNTTQVCKYVQVHKCTKNTSMCKYTSEHSSMQRSSPTDWPGPAFAALSPGDHLPLRPTTTTLSHHNIINKRVCTYMYIHKYLPLIPLRS